MEPSVNTELLRSRVDTFILNSLYEQDGYGYDILNYIESKTQGHYVMKQSSIYSVLKRLEKQGYIKSYQGEESKGGPRRYYSLTDKGREFLDEEQKQWAYTRTLLDNLVTDNPFSLEKDTPPFKPSDLRPLTKRSRNEDDISQQQPQQTKANAVQQTEIPIISQPKPFLGIIDEQKEQARRIMFTDLSKENIVDKEPPIQTKPEKTTINSAYKSIFNDIYNNQAKEEEQKIKTAKEIPAFKDEEIDCHHINDLKNVLKNEGYTLKAYRNDDMLGIAKRNMIYSNKLFRDTSLLTFLFVLLTVLILYRFKDYFFYSSKALLIIGLCTLIIPISGIIKYLIEPKRRQKALFNFKVILSYSVMVYLVIFVVNIIICLVSPAISLTMKDLQLYPPIILSLFIPISVIFYQVLYRSGLYKVKI